MNHLTKLKTISGYTALVIAALAGLVAFFIGFGKFWDGPISGDVPWYGLVGAAVYLLGSLALIAGIRGPN